MNQSLSVQSEDNFHIHPKRMKIALIVYPTCQATRYRKVIGVNYQMKNKYMRNKKNQTLKLKIREPLSLVTLEDPRKTIIVFHVAIIGVILLLSISGIIPAISQFQSMTNNSDQIPMSAESTYNSTSISNQTNMTVSIVPGASQSFTAERFFSPQIAQIQIGETIKWINHDNSPHSVYPGGLNLDVTYENFTDGAIVDIGQTYEFAFYSTGTFHYFCALHPWGNGTVIVK